MATTPDAPANPDALLNGELAIERRPTTITSDNAVDNMSAAADPDTCRICRGEATATEPLFYPCKCSGSIKFVHQDCLMEWLSHSQKKHCELCKTPFRFTKLYDPRMPKSLPLVIFLQHVTKFLLRNVISWLRFLLVVSIWLGWVPYAMRSAWSFLFWISDEGFSTPVGASASFNGSGTQSLASISSTSPDSTCPSSPLFAATSTVSGIGGVMDQFGANQTTLPVLLSIFKTFNFTDPLFNLVVRLFAGSPALAQSVSTANTTNVTAGVDWTTPRNHSSLLSDVEFLRAIAQHPVISSTIIAILEGQIITVLVIVSFILIILVRDYVVQQQPEINMRAAFAAAAGNLEALPPPAGDLMGPEEDDDMDADEPDEPGAAAQEMVQQDVPPRLQSDNQPDLPRPVATEGMGTAVDESLRYRASLDAFDPPPPAPSPDLSYASLATTAAGTDGQVEPVDGPSVGVAASDFSRIYREAGGDPLRILAIIKEENLELEMQYWVQRMKASIAGHPVKVGNELPASGSNQAQAATNQDAPTDDPWARAGSFSSTDSLDGAPTPSHSPESTDSHHDKGKGKDVPPPGPFNGALDEESEAPRADPAEDTASNADVPSGLQAPPIDFSKASWSFTATGEGSRSSNNPSVPVAELPMDKGREDSPTRPDWESLAADDDDWPHDDDGRDDLAPDLVRVGASPTERDHDGLSVVANASESGETNAAAAGPAPTGAVAAPAPEQRLALNDANPQQRVEPDGIVDRIANFMWGGIERNDAQDQDFNQDDQFDIDDFLNGDDDDEDLEFRDEEVANAARAAGLDPDAIEDAEDFEGIMELIGMRGPLAGLFQNAIFCAFLVVITIFMGIWIPYNIGRVTVWTLANPTRPMRLLFGLSKFIQDMTLVLAGALLFVSSAIVYLAERSIGLFPSRIINVVLNFSANLVMASCRRIFQSWISDPIISAAEVRNFSAISHQALLDLREDIVAVMAAMWSAIEFLLEGHADWNTDGILPLLSNVTAASLDGWKTLNAFLSQPDSWVISFGGPDTPVSINPELARWSGWDRFWVIIIGYAALSILAGLYLRRGTPFSTSQTGQEWEASIIDALNQASGVMKVILIISIEMLIFPLYCGMLLDIALLPLFENTTIMSRILFTYNKPLTSIFVHWFVGTGYMFHFALFVSMCRKIMRKGVLYFIRDPDDPEFHPVRDVLERNVTVQLRKILFSAFVYGALVIVCLGGVVWGLAYAVPNVLPIHYSSNEPVLEFPIDLLFYNFLMPLAVKVLRPSDGLHVMYTWWFRKCARSLRLTWFLFGERRVDEEGTLVLPEAEAAKVSWWEKLFLEINDSGRVVPKTWIKEATGGYPRRASAANMSTDLTDEYMEEMHLQREGLSQSGQIIPDGRFVRSPASDQVKIPKGKKVFLDVSARNERLDGKPDRPDTDLYSTLQYQFVYVPPHFRARIFLFILFIWMFAAITGVGITIVPLVFGRRMFKMLIPEHVRTNDIYAFSIGIYILGSLAYSLYHVRTILRTVARSIDDVTAGLPDQHAVRQVLGLLAKAAQLVYAYTILTVVLPALMAVLVEVYVVVPLHTLLYPEFLPPSHNEVASDTENNAGSHTMHVIQAWTLGMLYLKLFARAVVHFHGETRLASAVKAVMRRGWLNPDVAVLTRAFLLPGLLLAWLAIGMPTAFATLVVESFQVTDRRARVLIFRVAFPLNFVLLNTLVGLFTLGRVFETWTARIRDEAYLIGERLHNFGAGAAGVAFKEGRIANGRRAGEWRAAGANRV